MCFGLGRHAGERARIAYTESATYEQYRLYVYAEVSTSIMSSFELSYYTQQLSYIELRFASFLPYVGLHHAVISI